jgi:hypothetical protein
MTSEESRENRDSGSNEKVFQLPGYAWPSALAVGFIFAVAFFWMSARGHEHTSQGRFVGPGTCKECHQEQYDSWEKTRMANTFAVLLPGEKVEEKQMVGLDPNTDYSREEVCLPCHTTGYGSVGGFSSIEETPHMAGVSCEACHGHGGTYASTVMDPEDPAFRSSEARAAGLVYPPTQVVCQGCHNASSPFVGMDYQFDFDERVERGTHEHFQLKYEHEK